jgi:hypothetical protein
LQVGKSKIRFAVAPIRRPEQGEKRGVLGDGHQLTVALRPAGGREIARKDPNLRDKWI